MSDECSGCSEAAPPPHTPQPGIQHTPDHRRNCVSTPEEQPGPEEALARARAARAKMAAALNEDQEPEPDEPLGLVLPKHIKVPAELREKL